MNRQLASAVLSVSLIAGGALAGAALATQDTDDMPTKGSPRVLTSSVAPQDFIYEDGVARVWGSNRYATAAAISEAYGWTFDNTGSVYIASGQDYPDALSIGLSSLMDGPLLLVTASTIPSATRAELDRLKPCYIHVMGGEGVVNSTVFGQLKAYADPSLCEAP